VKTLSSTTTTASRFLLLGDSHARAIGLAARASRLPFCGGPIGSGRDFFADFYDVRDPGDVVFRAVESEGLYRGFLDELGVARLAALPVPLVATFGLSAHTVATTHNWDIYRAPDGGFTAGFLSSRLFDDIVRAMVRGALAFYGYALGLGLRVLAVMPPQRVPGMSDPDIFFAAQETVRRALEDIGVEVVDPRAQATDGTGFQRAAFCEANDAIHGNLAFGRLVLAELLARGL
jgi:hypothetical protein